MSGAKLDADSVSQLLRNFFVHGSYLKTEFGGATLIKFGEGEVRFPDWLKKDICLLDQTVGCKLKYNGPRTFMIGEVEPLHKLKNEETRETSADDVVMRFPRRILRVGEQFYRLRKDVELGRQGSSLQFDSPPDGLSGRLDEPGFPVLYGSPDLEICVHECRLTKADECHVAVLEAAEPLELLDLAGDLEIDGKTPFESLYIAIRFVFEAEAHSYPIARAIAKAAKRAGLRGIAFPSYFNSVRGSEIQNLAIFGHPVADQSLKVVCINRLQIETARYNVLLGPCLPEIGTW